MKIRDINPDYTWRFNHDVDFINVMKSTKPGFYRLTTYLKGGKELSFHHFPEFSIWICQEQSL